MMNINKLFLGFSVIALSALSASAAETGGRYVLPSGITYSSYSTYLNITCPQDGSAPVISGAGGFFANLSQPIDGDKLDIVSGLLTEATADSAQKVQTVDGNTVQIRNNINSPWLTVGTYSSEGVQSYCTAYLAWLATPIPHPNDIPEMGTSLVTLNPGVTLSFSRSQDMGFFGCASWENLGQSISGKLVYNVSVSVPGSPSQSFVSEVEQDFSPHDSGCKNWKEAPWVSQ